MACLVSTIIKAPSPDDYCVDLRASDSLLFGCFNSSNTIQAYSLPSLSHITSIPTGSSSVLSEISLLDESTVFWSDRAGSIGVIDIRSNTSSHSLQTREEIFSIDSAGHYLATGSNKGINIFDIRTFKPFKSYTELYTDDNDVTCVRFNQNDNRILLSCSEDSLMAVCNIESIDEDDYTLINVDEPALKVGFCGNTMFCVSINRLVSYDVHLENIEVPPEVLFRYRLNELQGFNPGIGYFLGEYLETERVMLAGGHEGELYAYSPGDTRRFYIGQGHTATIRCSVMIKGIIITGAEDSAILAWSLQEGPPEVPEKFTLGNQRNKPHKEENYFNPY